MFRDPFGDLPAQNADEATKETEKRAFFPKTFFGKIREKY